MHSEQFDQALRSWTSSFCQKHGQQAPSEEWFSAINRRLPLGLRETLGSGLREGSIIPLDAGRFTLPGLPADKAFTWFARAEGKPPWVNWEWFLHAAEYARIHALGTPLGFDVRFEHEYMDVAVYRDGRVFACYEVKESARKLDVLTTAVIRWGKGGIRLDLPDRNKDALRKAKYLIRHRPDYFSTVAIGKRYEFSVDYMEREGGLPGFDLQPDVIPLN